LFAGRECGKNAQVKPPLPMFNLTRQQQTLLLVGLLLFLTGLAVKAWRTMNPPAAVTHIENP
jgi:hypothetical protein